MMRRIRWAVMALSSAALVLTTTQAVAINSYNATPAPERTETGALLVLWDKDGDGTAENFDWHCSGAMVDSDTYLTAAHCVTDWSPDPADDRYFVSLEQDVQTLIDTAPYDFQTQGPQLAAWFVAHHYAVEGTAAHDPAFGHDQADSHDIGVVDFATQATTPADVWGFTPATLPTAGQLSALGSRALDALDWTVVGYGTQEAVRGPGGQTHPGGGVRMKAPEDFLSLNKAWVWLSMIEPQGNGGACYGDSGGPNFVGIGGTLVLAATTITGDTPCYATNVVYRTDTASARNFLKTYVTLP
jgi:Trypsin